MLRSDQLVALQVASYDPAGPLVIDPALAYSRYLGGSGFDGGAGITVDASGNACYRPDHILGFSHYLGRIPEHFRR